MFKIWKNYWFLDILIKHVSMQIGQRLIKSKILYNYTSVRSRLSDTYSFLSFIHIKKKYEHEI